MKKRPTLPLVLWETTTACNLECVHCRRLEVGKEISKEDLSSEEVFHFIEGLAYDFDPPPILVLSGGEPLVRPDIFDIVRFAEIKGVPLALATNGTLIDSTTAKRIASSGIKRVSVSLDGSCPDTHDRFRKMPGSFNKAIRGITLLRSFNVPFQINTTLTRNNLGELEAIYRLCLELGADGLYLFLLVPVGCGMEIKDEFQLSSEEYEESLLKIHRFSRQGKIHIRPICAPHYFRILAQNKSSFPKRKDTSSFDQITKGCLAGTGICFISHKGEVFPCGYLPVICGNVREQNLKDIWKDSPIFGTLREPELLEGKCGLCRFKWICSGCRARAFEESDDYLAEEPNCLYQPEQYTQR
jgi:radical SAM protein with 4Fe4S-binding SPASM domain